MRRNYNARRENQTVIEIRPIQPDEWLAAKMLIYRVAHVIFSETRPLEEAIADFDSRGALKDMDDIQTNYFDNGGVFLVMIEDGEIVGTGAIRFHAPGVCELKRVWFLISHHGRGLGYRMIHELLEFAREQSYKKIILETSPIAQNRAYDLYKRIGFRDSHIDPNNPEDMFMIMDL